MSGEGRHPFNTALLGGGTTAPASSLFNYVTGSPNAAGPAAFTDHFFVPAQSGVSGVLSKTLDAITLSGSATVDIAGSASQTLGSVTLSSASTLDISGTLSKSLSSIALSATGAIDIVGSSTNALANITLSSTGVLDVFGTLSSSFADLTAASTGTLEIRGSLASSLADISGSGAGTNDINGILNATLGDVLLMATATNEGGEQVVTPVVIETDGYWQIGRRIIWKQRPKAAEPARAEAAIVKRIAKKLTAVAKDDRPKAASLYVNRAMRMLAGFIESKRAHSVAHGNADRLTNEEIALIKAYWKSVEATALALMEEEDDDDLLLLA